MADVDEALNTAGYAMFALQQPLTLAALAESAQKAELPLAEGIPVARLVMDPNEPARDEPAQISPERVDVLLDGAPELDAHGAVRHRRIGDPIPLD